MELLFDRLNIQQHIRMVMAGLRAKQGFCNGNVLFR